MKTTLPKFYRDVSSWVKPLEAHHAGRLKCGRGCNECCVDGITVFEIEANPIREKYSSLLAKGNPHPEGKCAFLDLDGSCRIYEDRPYVCRTQGLPLRWIDDDARFEMRDICPLNADGEPLESLDSKYCWTIGPFENQLAVMQRSSYGTLRRVRLRDLFDQPNHDGAWALLRTDDNGVEYVGQKFSSESEVRHQKDRLERSNHKQHYTVEYQGEK